MVTVAVDGMGGDNAPKCMVEGAVDALQKNSELHVLLVGQPEILNKELSSYTYDKSRLELVPASEVISMEDNPLLAVRHKTDSSITVGLRLIKEHKADAFVSCGSTGAIVVGGQIVAGRIKGVKRSPLAAIIPSVKGPILLLDSGANVDAKPEDLLQYSQMGSLYMEGVMGVKKPRVGLVNIGVEEEKGNALSKEAYKLLKACDDINFVGNIEARDIPFGKCDVLVCEAFTGNVILKMYEGVGKALIGEIKKSMLSSFKGKVAALLVRSSLKGVVKKFDSSEYGGAPMIGLKGLVVKAHGSSTAKEVSNACQQCIAFANADIAGRIAEKLSSGPAK